MSVCATLHHQNKRSQWTKLQGTETALTWKVIMKGKIHLARICIDETHRFDAEEKKESN